MKLRKMLVFINTIKSTWDFLQEDIKIAISNMIVLKNKEESMQGLEITKEQKHLVQGMNRWAGSKILVIMTNQEEDILSMTVQKHLLNQLISEEIPPIQISHQHTHQVKVQVLMATFKDKNFLHKEDKDKLELISAETNQEDRMLSQWEEM